MSKFEIEYPKGHPYYGLSRDEITEKLRKSHSRDGDAMLTEMKLKQPILDQMEKNKQEAMALDKKFENVNRPLRMLGDLTYSAIEIITPDIFDEEFYGIDDDYGSLNENIARRYNLDGSKKTTQQLKDEGLFHITGGIDAVLPEQAPDYIQYLNELKELGDRNQQELSNKVAGNDINLLKSQYEKGINEINAAFNEYLQNAPAENRESLEQGRQQTLAKAEQDYKFQMRQMLIAYPSSTAAIELAKNPEQASLLGLDGILPNQTEIGVSDDNQNEHIDKVGLYPHIQDLKDLHHEELYETWSNADMVEKGAYRDMLLSTPEGRDIYERKSGIELLPSDGYKYMTGAIWDGFAKAVTEGFAMFSPEYWRLAARSFAVSGGNFIDNQGKPIIFENEQEEELYRDIAYGRLSEEIDTYLEKRAYKLKDDYRTSIDIWKYGKTPQGLFRAAVEADGMNVSQGFGQGLGSVGPMVLSAIVFRSGAGVALNAGRTGLASSLGTLGTMSSITLGTSMMMGHTLSDARANGLRPDEAFKYSLMASSMVGMSDGLVFNHIIGKPVQNYAQGMSKQINTVALRQLGGKSMAEVGVTANMLNTIKATRKVLGQNILQFNWAKVKTASPFVVSGAITEGITETGQYYIELANREYFSGSQSQSERYLNKKTLEFLRRTRPELAKEYQKSRGEFTFEGAKANWNQAFTEGFYGSIVGGLLGGGNVMVSPLQAESLTYKLIKATQDGNFSYYGKLRQMAESAKDAGRIGDNVYDNILENINFIENNKELIKSVPKNGSGYTADVTRARAVRQLLHLDQFENKLQSILQNEEVADAGIEIDGETISMRDYVKKASLVLQMAKMSIQNTGQALTPGDINALTQPDLGINPEQQESLDSLTFKDFFGAVESANKQLLDAGLPNTGAHHLQDAMLAEHMHKFVAAQSEIRELEKKHKDDKNKLKKETDKVVERLNEELGLSSQSVAALANSGSASYLFQQIKAWRDSNWRSKTEEEQDAILGQNSRMGQKGESELSSPDYGDFDLIEKIHNAEATAEEFEASKRQLIKQGASETDADAYLRGKSLDPKTRQELNFQLDLQSYKKFNPNTFNKQGDLDLEIAASEFTTSAFNLAQRFGISLEELQNANVSKGASGKYTLNAIRQYIQDNNLVELQTAELTKQEEESRRRAREARSKRVKAEEQIVQKTTKKARKKIQREVEKPRKPINEVARDIYFKVTKEKQGKAKYSRLQMVQEKLNSDAAFKEFLVKELSKRISDVDVHFVGEIISKYGVRALGMAVGSSVIISDDATQDTIVHEYLEIYYDTMKRFFPDLNKRAKKQLKKTALYQRVQQKYPTLDEDGLIKETMIILASKSSLESLRAEFKGVRLSTFEKVKNLIKEFFTSVRSVLGLETYQDAAELLARNFNSSKGLKVANGPSVAQYSFAELTANDLIRKATMSEMVKLIMSPEQDVKMFEQRLKAAMLIDFEEFLSDEVNAREYSQEKLAQMIVDAKKNQDRTTDELIDDLEHNELMYLAYENKYEAAIDRVTKTKQKFTLAKDLEGQLNLFEPSTRIQEEEIQEASTSVKFLLNNLFDIDFNPINEGDAFAFAAVTAGMSTSKNNFLDLLNSVNGNSSYTRTAGAIRTLFGSLDENMSNMLFTEMASFVVRQALGYDIGIDNGKINVIVTDMTNNSSLGARNFAGDIARKVSKKKTFTDVINALYRTSRNFEAGKYDSDENYKLNKLTDIAEAFNTLGYPEITLEALQSSKYMQNSKNATGIFFMLRKLIGETDKGKFNLEDPSSVRDFLVKNELSRIRGLFETMGHSSLSSSYISKNGDRKPATEYGAWTHELIRHFSQLEESYANSDFYKNNPVFKHLQKLNKEGKLDHSVFQYLDAQTSKQTGLSFDYENLTAETITLLAFKNFMLGYNQDTYVQWAGPLGARGRHLSLRLPKPTDEQIRQYNKRYKGTKKQITQKKYVDVRNVLLGLNVDLEQFGIKNNADLESKIKEFVYADFVNRIAIQEMFSYGDLSKQKSFENAYKRSDAAESSGLKIHFNEDQKVYYFYYPNLSKDAKFNEKTVPVEDATDSFAFMNNNLNEHIKLQAGSFRGLGINQKGVLYQINENGELDYWKNSSVVPNTVQDQNYQDKAELLNQLEEKIRLETGEQNPFIILTADSSQKGSVDVSQSVVSDPNNIEDVKPHVVQPYNFRIQQVASKNVEGKKAKLSIQLLSKVLTYANAKQKQTILCELATQLGAQVDQKLEQLGTSAQLLTKLLNNNIGEVHPSTIEIVQEIIEKGYTNLDHPDIANQLQSLMLKTLTNAGIRLELPGSELHMIPDLEENLDNALKFGVRTNPDGTRVIETEVKVPEGFAEIGEEVISVRVPMSGPFSSFVAKVVGFTPKGTNMIMNPSAYIWMSNADYDFDKLITIKKGDNAKQNKLIDSMIDVMKSPEWIAASENELTTDGIKQHIEKNPAYDKRKDFAGGSILEEARLFEQAQVAEKTIGILASSSRVYDLLVQEKVKLNKPITIKGKQYTEFFNDFEKRGADQAEMLQLALDDLKEMIMSSTGVTLETAFSAAMMMMLGMSKEQVIDYFNDTDVKKVMQEYTRIVRDNIKSVPFAFEDRTQKFEKTLGLAAKNVDVRLVKVMPLVQLNNLANELAPIFKIVGMASKGVGNNVYEFQSAYTGVNENNAGVFIDKSVVNDIMSRRDNSQTRDLFNKISKGFLSKHFTVGDQTNFDLISQIIGKTNSGAVRGAMDNLVRIVETAQLLNFNYRSASNFMNSFASEEIQKIKDVFNGNPFVDRVQTAELADVNVLSFNNQGMDKAEIRQAVRDGFTRLPRVIQDLFIDYAVLNGDTKRTDTNYYSALPNSFIKKQLAAHNKFLGKNFAKNRGLQDILERLYNEEEKPSFVENYGAKTVFNVRLKGTKPARPTPLQFIVGNQVEFTEGAETITGIINGPQQNTVFLPDQALQAIEQYTGLSFEGLALIKREGLSSLVDLSTGRVMYNIQGDYVTMQDAVQALYTDVSSSEQARNKIENFLRGTDQEYKNIIKADKDNAFGTILGFYADKGLGVEKVAMMTDSSTMKAMQAKLKELYPDIVVFKNKPSFIPKGASGAAFITNLNGAMVRGVNWAHNSGNPELAPHEYAHHYVDMFRSDALVQEGIRKYGEEGLVLRMGRAHVDRYQDSTFKKFIRRVWNRIKQYLGHGDIAMMLEERFAKGQGVSQASENLSAFKNATVGLFVDKSKEDLIYLRDKNVALNLETIVESFTQVPGQAVSPLISESLDIDEFVPLTTRAEQEAGKTIPPTTQRIITTLASDVIKISKPLGVTPAEALKRYVAVGTTEEQGGARSLVQRVQKLSESIGAFKYQGKQHIIEPRRLQNLVDKINSEPAFLQEVSDLLQDGGVVNAETSQEAVDALNDILRMTSAVNYARQRGQSLFVGFEGGNVIDMDVATDIMNNELIVDQESVIRGLDGIIESASGLRNTLELALKYANAAASFPLNIYATPEALFYGMLRGDTQAMLATGKDNSLIKEVFYQQFNHSEGRQNEIIRGLNRIFNANLGIDPKVILDMANNESIRFKKDVDKHLKEKAKQKVEHRQGVVSLTKMELLNLYMLLQDGRIEQKFVDGSQTFSVNTSREGAQETETYTLNRENIQSIRDAVLGDQVLRSLSIAFKAENDARYERLNRVYKALHGVDMIQEENYFPVFRADVDETIEGATGISFDDTNQDLLSPSFTNPRNVFAIKNFVIGDALDLHSRNRARVANYVAFAIPMYNATQALSRLKGQENITVKKELGTGILKTKKKKYEGSTWLFMQELFLQQLNDRYMGNTPSNVNEKIQNQKESRTRTFRKALGWLSVRALSTAGVFPKQAVSYTTVPNVIPAKYSLAPDTDNIAGTANSILQAIGFPIAGAVSNIIQSFVTPITGGKMTIIPQKESTKQFFNNFEEMIKYSPLANQRYTEGKVDIFVSAAMESGDARVKLKGGLGSVAAYPLNVLSNFVGERNPFMTAIQTMDAATLSLIWASSKRMVKGEYPNIKENTPEFFRAAQQIFEAAVRETQPIYDFTNRAPILRGGQEGLLGGASDIVRLAMVFSTQRLQNVNIITKGYLKHKHQIGENPGGDFAKSFISLVANSLGIAGINMFVTPALRSVWGVEPPEEKRKQSKSEIFAYESLKVLLQNNPVVRTELIDALAKQLTGSDYAAYRGKSETLIEQIVTDITRLGAKDELRDEDYARLAGLLLTASTFLLKGKSFNIGKAKVNIPTPGTREYERMFQEKDNPAMKPYIYKQGDIPTTEMKPVDMFDVPTFTP